MAKSLDINRRKKSSSDDTDAGDQSTVSPPSPSADPSTEETASTEFYADEPDGIRSPRSALTSLNFILGFILLLLIGAAIYLYIKSSQSSTESGTAEQTVRQQLKDTPSPSPSTEGSKETDQTAAEPPPAARPVSVKVLNGSGVAGAASNLAAVLTGAGITVTGTGNAKSFNYQRTTIFYRTEHKTEAEGVAAATKKDPVLEENNSSVTANPPIVVVAGRD